MNKTYKRDIVHGTLWSLVGQVGYMAIALISNIILARILSPHEFGQVGIVMFFIITGKVITESGLSGALIRKKYTSEADYSTVFIFNLITAAVLVILLISTSGLIADFYKDSALRNIIIVSSIVLIINAFQISHTAKLIHQLKFKKKGIYQFLSILISAIIAIILALNGYGVWSIVTMQILTALFLTILLWTFEDKVSFYGFSKESFKELYKFGVNTTLASVMNSFFDNIYQLILGKYFAISQTGLFYQAKKLQEVPGQIINSVVNGPVFSSLSKIQNDQQFFMQFYKRIATLYTVFIGAICVFIYYYAENLILLLYGKQWIGATFFLKILSMATFFYLQEMINRLIFKIFNRTEKILYLELIKKSIQAITIVVGIYFKDMGWLLYGFLLTSVISYVMNLLLTKRLLNDNSWYELIVVLKIIFISLLTVGIGLKVQVAFHLEGYSSFLLLPLLSLAFIVGVKMFNVSNILNDLKMVRSLMKLEK
tara:strand:+ start:827 stop:2278 length:1452 start_codon:yes stop_codon:yes gene_type:complete